jgi:hypothetical protein
MKVRKWKLEIIQTKVTGKKELNEENTWTMIIVEACVSVCCVTHAVLVLNNIILYVIGNKVSLVAAGRRHSKQLLL